MTGGPRACLVVGSIAYVALVVAAAGSLGVNYEEVVPYVLSPIEVTDAGPIGTGQGTPPRFVVSTQLPRLAFEPAPDLRLPLLNQPYMTNHLSYGGVVLAAAGIDRLWAARLWHAAFGLVLLWLVYDVAILLGLSTRAALIAFVTAATSLPVTFMFTWARFDESLPSFAPVAVLWAALRYTRDRQPRWVWLGIVAAAFGVSGKLTTLWPLTGLAVAAIIAGWRWPSGRTVLLPALATAPLFAPILAFAIAESATGNEVGRRLGYLTDLFSGDVIVGTAANLIDYLGNWGGILSEAIRGAGARAPNVAGWLLVSGTLLWLAARVLSPGAPPRRQRLETHMLTVVAIVFTLVAMFFREHRDYQFSLLVPLYALALAAFLDHAARFLDRRLPAWVAGAAVCALPLGANLWDQRGLHDDIASAQNAMFDLGVQRASAAWLAAHGAQRPIVVTFYAVGTYEFLTDGLVRPVYAFPRVRRAKDGRPEPDLQATWRVLLGDGAEQTRFAVLPLGENPIEARHFDEPGIRDALLKVASGERVAVFSNRRGEPTLEVWKVTLLPPRVAAAGIAEELDRC